VDVVVWKAEVDGDPRHTWDKIVPWSKLFDAVLNAQTRLLFR
jgi:hypothetical protein